MSLTEPTGHDLARRPALLVINPKSRRGSTSASEARAALLGAGVPILERECAKAKQLSDLIRSTVPLVDSVVIAGGDGTLNAALPGLLDSRQPLGILPLGTGNDLARTLGIPPDLQAAARIIAARHIKRIDVGMANDKPFFNVASVGFGADLTRALTRDAKKRWGTLGYVVAALRALDRLRPFTVEIEQNGTVERSRTIHLAIGNGSHYGGGMVLAEAAIDDGRLEVRSLEVDSRWQLLVALPSVREGRHGRWRIIGTGPGLDILARTRRPRSVNTDGEITTKTPARFRVLPGAVGVFVP